MVFGLGLFQRLLVYQDFIFLVYFTQKYIILFYFLTKDRSNDYEKFVKFIVFNNNLLLELHNWLDKMGFCTHQVLSLGQHHTYYLYSSLDWMGAQFLSYQLKQGM